jgi:cytochrome c biogenesis protein CcmG/thiol:disulfide interchange protein DsbE
LPSTPSSPDGARRPSRRAIVVLVVLSVALPLALLTVILTVGGDDDGDDVVSPPPGAVTANVDIGEALPDFELDDLDDDPVRLSEFRGRPLVLTFFASWCHPCEEEMPLLEEALADMPEAFAVLAVSYEDLERDSRDFVDRLGVTYPVALDPGGDVKDAYGINAIPQTFFVDADGVLRDRVYGITSRDALDEPLDALLDS